MWVVNGAAVGGFGANANVNHTMGFKLDLRIAVKEMRMSARTKRPVARFGKIMMMWSCTYDADDAPRRQFDARMWNTSSRQADYLTISKFSNCG